MTNEVIKETLLSIEDTTLDFSVTQSGKKSRKVNGLYKPDTQEIILHNKNFERDGVLDENLLVYTAIHEYAHHQHACIRGGTLSAKAHSAEFWAIFHGLLEKAEKKGVYDNRFSETSELGQLTQKIREQYLKKSGELIKEFGTLLLQAYALCEKEGIRFEDYVDRTLCIPRTASKLALKINELDIASEAGIDNMRFLAGIRNEDDRLLCENALKSGKSPDSVRYALKIKQPPNTPPRPPSDEDRRTALEKEKARIERTIETLHVRLTQVERELGKKGNTDRI
jgi:hypothetical protein